MLLPSASLHSANAKGSSAEMFVIMIGFLIVTSSIMMIATDGDADYNPWIPDGSTDSGGYQPVGINWNKQSVCLCHIIGSK